MNDLQTLATPTMKRRVLLAVVAGVAAVVPIIAFASPAHAATNAVAAFTTLPTCGNTWNTYTVPNGIVSATVTLSGGGGGGGNTQTSSGLAGDGGGGSSVTTTLTGLTPGQTLSLTIGCGGGGGQGSAGTFRSGGMGGTSAYGPGAMGGTDANGNEQGGGGGGATALCVGSGACTSALVVAAGGGGGGNAWRCCVGQTSNGGDGGNASAAGNTTTGGAGGNGTDASGANGGGGGGATTAAVGGGGTGGGEAGLAGSGQTGGRGGSSNTTLQTDTGGGGGGGGFFGGGGGSGHGVLSAAGGGGGAGAGFSVAAATFSANTTKTNGCGQNRNVCTSVGTASGGRAGPNCTGFLCTTNATGFTGSRGTASIVWNVVGRTATWNTLGTAQAGVNFATQPSITIRDYNGGLVLNESVTVSQLSGPTANALVCTGGLTVTTNASGVANLTGCRIDGLIGTYTFQVTDNGGGNPALLVGNGSITITAGNASALAYTTQPGGGAVAATWATQPAVRVTDAFGNTITGSTASISLSISAQPGSGAVLACTPNPRNAVAGTATFTGCNIIGTAGNYQITANSAGLAGVQSNPFPITVGPANKLGFSTQPVGNVAEGVALSTQPVVQIQDAGGNLVTSDTSTVTLALASGPASGVLSCTGGLSLAAVGGVASFTGCQITGTAAAGTYTMIATDPPLASATSNPFTINVGPATQLSISNQPNGGVTGIAWSSQPGVTVLDAFGNTVTASTAPITLSIASQPASGATLGCASNPLSATAGVANFSGCQITGTVGTYTLDATSPGLTTATTNPFAITAGAAAKLAFATQPGGGTNGATWGTQPVVVVQDVGGNTISSTAPITLTIASQPGGGGTLSCTVMPVNAISGVAGFNGCQITGAAGSYTLSATSPGLTSATSDPFTISPGAATTVAFSTHPVGGVAEGVALPTQPAVTLTDASGNIVTNDSTSTVTLAIASGPASGVLTCTGGLSLTVTAGVATFAGCQVTGTAAAGTYTLSATVGALPTATSSSFTIIVGPATKLAFGTGPSNVSAYLTMTPAVTVQVQDAFGNSVSSGGTLITLSLSSGSLASGGTATTNAGGLATFADISINVANTYTLSAGAAGLTGTGPSGSFVVAPIAGAGLRGQVTAQTGGAVLSGIRVDVYQPNGLLMGTVYTDVGGRWVVGGLVTKKYTIKFSDPNAVYATEWYNDRTSLATATVLAITTGTVTAANSSLL